MDWKDDTTCLIVWLDDVAAEAVESDVRDMHVELKIDFLVDECSVYVSFLPSMHLLE